MNTLAAFTIALSIYGSGKPPVIIQFKTLALCFEGVMALSKDYPEAVCRGPGGLAIKHTPSK
jgi:hypothetical protein